MDFVVPVSRHVTNRKDERMKETHHQIQMPRFAAPSFTIFSFLIFFPPITLLLSERIHATKFMSSVASVHG